MSLPLHESSTSFYFVDKKQPIQTWTIFCFVILETYTYLRQERKIGFEKLTNCTWRRGPWFNVGIIYSTLQTRNKSHGIYTFCPCAIEGTLVRNTLLGIDLRRWPLRD